MVIKIKRVYEPYSKDDGYRILVDRLWPRGIKKEDARIDEWMKEIAPSTSLRHWFNHDMEKWKEFQQKYEAELKASNGLSKLSAAINKHKTVTLIFSAREEKYNHAMVLQQLILKGAQR